MKLLVLSSWYPLPPANGSKLRAWHLLRTLAARHDVTLLTFAEPGEADDASRRELAALCRRVRVIAGNPHKPVRRLRFAGFFDRMPRSYQDTRSPEMAAAVREAGADADAVIAFQIGTALYAPSAPDVPWVFDEAEATVIRDGVTPAPTAHRRLRQAITWRKYAAFTRDLVSRCAWTTVVSAPERQCLLDAGCDERRVVVLPNGVDDALLHRAGPRDPASVIYAGSVTYAPNHDAVAYFVQEILPLVRARRPELAFTVTGRHDGVDLTPLNGDGVTFTGQVADIAGHVAAAAICVVPLRLGGGTRLKILEAMALGTPVVSTAKGAEGLEVRADEHLLIADTPAEFARAVERLLADPALGSRLAAAARRLVAERYTWSHLGTDLETLVDAARGQRRDRGFAGTHA